MILLAIGFVLNAQALVWEQGAGLSSGTHRIVHRTVLPNGLRVVVAPDSSSATVAVQMWYHVGSKNDPVGRTGMAHFFEHLMYKKTEHYPDGAFDRLMDEAGSEDGNAFTGPDTTLYTQELPTAALDLVLKLEAERMRYLSLTQAHLDSEREVVHNERRFRDENNPDGALNQALYALAFEKHPYGKPIIGVPRDLDQISVEDTTAFYRRYYHPHRAVLVLVGDVTPRQVEARVVRYFGNIPSPPFANDAIPAEPPITAPRKQILPLVTSVTKLLVGYPIPSATHTHTPALWMLDAYLASGRSNFLNRELVETGIASAADCEMADQDQTSLIVFSLSLQKGVTVERAQEKLNQLLETLRTHEISTEEVRRAKYVFEHELHESQISHTDRATWLGKAEIFFGHWKSGKMLMSSIKKIKPSQLLKVAQEIFDPKKQVTVIGVPK